MPIVSAIVGAIGAVATAIGGALAGAASFLTGGTLLAKVAMAGLSMAAQYALQKFLGPKPPAAQASKLETQYGEKLAREIVQGTVGTAGHHVYRNAYGKGNRTVQDVYVLSHFNISGVSRVRYKGEWKTLGGTPDAERGLRIQGIDAEIWVKVYTGRMDQTADAGLIARSNPAGRWTGNHRGAGVAYAVVTSALHRETLPSPWEAFFEVVGVTYDWRKDDTVGGEGDHRFDDPTTWEPTTNPVLMAYCATRGFWRGDEKIAGKGRPASALPLSYWTLAANICDEMVEGKRRYQAAAILSSGEGTTHDANLRPLLEACAASWLEMVGQEYPIVGANQTPVTTFTDDDIVIDEPFRFSAKRTRSELVNTVAGTYVDPTSFYQAMPLATRIDDVALAADGERLAVPLSFSAVTEPACVDRLADIALRASRYQGSADLCLRPKFLALRPGQWVTWQSARYGWTKQFQVLSKRLGAFGPKGTRNVFVSLQEVGAGIFDPTAYVTVPPDGVLQGAPDFLAEVQNLLLSGVKVEDEDTGNQYPAIRAAWDAIDDPTVVGVDIRYRPKSQPDAILYHPTVSDDITVTTIADGVVSSTLFEVSTRLMTSPYRVTFWSAWQEVMTPDAPHTDVRAYLKNLGEDVYATLQRYRAEVEDLRAYMRLLAEGSDEVAGRVADERHVAVRFRDAAAIALSALTAAISDEDGNLIAVAQALVAVQALVGNVSADGLRKIEVQAGSGDVVARLVDMVRATIGDVWVEAGTIVEVGFEGGDPLKPFANYIIMGRKVMFMDDEGNVYALFGEDGLTIENARLGTLTFDQLQSTNGKLILRGAGNDAYIEMFS
ncbi:MAG: hypothetical protein F9K43_07655 [Bauldia sp.]|nr:MAG: hypothetical protein F9K43_07655 [Bauldia sp.]